MTSQYQADLAPTQYVDGPLGERFAYRRLGRPSSTPLVLTLRLRGTIDHWDPAFLDAVSRDREVIVFDNRGLNASTGTPASSVPELVDGAIAFIHALGLEKVDLLGWSLGGTVAQGIALTEPGLVRRLIVAGSTPGGIPEMPRMSERVLSIVTKPVADDEDFLYLFFPETPEGRKSGQQSLERLRYRLETSNAAISPEAARGQLTALGSFEGYWKRLNELTIPVLLANGTNDVMIDADHTYAAARKLTNARTVFWSDAGHAFLFQHIEDFARQIDWFLADAG
ncbi:alpha/beta fold hydrolase [Acrocarpospora catenulata]|uniref:alpha/beta fold hydrolase n=1 Tax=Acrocarpospora catenulata TaxID=2836182 RepID=UPI001BDA5D09|nr:alpha/beta hydrolase [Acrocarpospora catenulata]